MQAVPQGRRRLFAKERKVDGMDGTGFRFAASADDIEAELRRIEGNAGMAVNAIARIPWDEEVEQLP